MYLNLVKRPLRIFVATLALFVLTACGQGDGLPPVAGTPQPPLTGVLIDSPVSGVSWQSSGGEAGVTNALGEFRYLPFDMVTFKIGGITLGTAEGAPYLTVVELTSSPDPTATAALNLMIFLQSIDEDGDPTNGISISAAAAAAAANLTLDFSSASFATDVVAVVNAMAPGNTVVSAAEALNHFYTTYSDLNGTDTFSFLFPGYPPVGGGSETFQLVFSDEFNSGDAPNPAVWNAETGYGPDNFGWGNNEWQLYTTDSQNLRVEDGNLVIQARCETPPCGVRDGSITSARITTQNKFNFKFGKVVARIKPPVGTATWPAFWALGSKFSETGWPRSGEIDFMEMFQGVSNDRTSHSTMHWCDETVQAPNTCSFPEGWKFFTESRAFASSLGDDFHVWEADWNEDRINMSIDGIQYFSRAIEVETMEEFLEEFFLILNVAMGGTLGSNNQPPTGAETFPQTMLVDYVRVFQNTGTISATAETIDFEEAAENYDFGISGGFGGGAAAVITNPVAEGINTSGQVVQMLKFEGEVFAGTKFALPSSLFVPSGSIFTMKVWSPREVSVLFKLEGASEAERSVTHTGSGWEELTFDFGSFNGSVDFYTIIFDLGVVGDAGGDPDNWTFYFDDITFIPSTGGGGSPGGGTGDFPIDFESGAETYNFGLSGGFGGGASAVVVNPVMDSGNMSGQVARMLKFAGEVFAGSLLELSSPVDVVSGSVFTMKVWSPRAVMVLLKLEGANEAEINLAHSGSGWEELTYDFGSFSGSVEGVTLIFDLGTVGNADTDPDNWTFYFDDITYIPPADGGDPGDPVVFTGDFEENPLNYDFGTDGGFGGGFAEVVLNPVADANNDSAQVVRLLKFLGEVFAGSKLTLPDPVEVMTGSSYTMNVWSQRPVMVLLKLEGATEDEVEVAHGGTGWEVLTFDFSSFSGTVEGYSFIFDLGMIGNADNDPDNWTFYIDDITLVPPGGMDPGGGLAQIDLPITFDDATVDYSVTDFGDPVAAMTTLVADPDDSANMVASTTKPAGAPVWAGTTMSTVDGLATAIPFTVNDTTIGMRVYSPDAGIPVRLKADNVVNGTVSVETEAMTTVANQWETLIFDFANQVDQTPALDVGVSYTSLSVFFNFGTDGDTAGTKTYLWDDVEFGVTDMTAPMLATVGISSSNANPALAAAGDVVTLSLTANEPIMAPAVTISGGAATVTGADTAWQATRTLTAMDTEGAITFSIGYSDLAGNAGAPVTQPTDMSAVTFDATAPSVSISGVAASITTLDPITVTFQFDEDVSGFDISDIAVTNGIASAFASADAATYTASVTPAGEGELTVNVAAAAAADAAGNASVAATEVAALIDSIAPMVVVAGVPADFNTLASISVTFQFSEPVTGFDVSDIQATNGAASAFVAVDGDTFTADVTPDGAGDLTVGVAAGAAQDAAGNPSVVASDVTALIDAEAPTVAIEGVPTDFATLDPIGVTFQFSEAVTGFDVSDILATNGTAGGFAVVDSDTYTATITPDGNGDLTVSVAAGAAQDAVGNQSGAAAEATALIDAVVPTVVIQGAPTEFTTLAAINVTFQFSEAVSGFTIGDIQITNGSRSAFVAVDADTYTANVTPNGAGDLTIAVAAGAAQDGVGNPSAAATNVVVTNALDMDAPLFTAISIASDNANPAFATTGDVVTINMTANEDIAPPVVTINGIAADAVTGMGTTWQATRMLTVSDPEAEIGFTLDFEDLDGNAGPQSTVTTDASSVTFDITAPTLALSAPATTFEMLDPIEVTFQFSEDVSGFAAEDIAVTNGTASMFASVDAATYTADVTPDGMGSLTVSVAAGAAQDFAGLPSVMATDLVISNNVDEQAPELSTVSISSDNTNPTVAATGDTVTINITADEDIAEPVVMINGAAADAVTGSGAEWEATRTLLATDAEGPVMFTIDFEDLAGNTGIQVTATNDGSAVEFDRTDPELTISGLAAAFTALDPVSVTFGFTEDVTGFDASDINVTNGAATAFVEVNPATYTADVTPDGMGDLTVAVAAEQATDAAGNPNTAASESSTQEGWRLVWSDNFDGTSLDPANWTARTDGDCPAPCDGVQTYSEANVTVAGGLLNIRAQQNAGPTYISGLIDTRGKHELKYGRVEIDAIMPGTLGTRPSLLMLPATDTYGPWPQSGEINIANAPDLGDGLGTLLEHNLQYGLPVPENTLTGDTSDAPANVTTVATTYAIEWEAGEIRWFVDDVNVLTQSEANWYAYGENADGVYTPGTDDAPFNQDFYLALNLAIDGSADGSMNFPQDLQIDAVRVYECANPIDPLAGNGCSTGDDLVLPVEAPDAPYTETLPVYINALTMPGFIDETMTSYDIMLEDSIETSDMSDFVTSTTDAVDPDGGFLWNIDYSPAVAMPRADIRVQPGDIADFNAFFDLTGGGTAGEILFRMRVISESGTPVVTVGLDDSGTGTGEVTVPYTADGQWQNVSVKISDVVTDSVMSGTTLDLADLVSIFRVSITGGSLINLDIDDIEVKVACRDTNGCEATPRLTEIPEVVIYTEGYEDFDINGTSIFDFSDPLDPIVWRYFNVVYENDVYQFDYAGIAPNGPQISALVTGETGVEQGLQALSVYSDYECCTGNPNTGHQSPTGMGTVEVNVLREFDGLLADGDAGKILRLKFEAKRGNIGGASEALAFIKVLDSTGNAFTLTADATQDTTTTPVGWTSYTIEVVVGDWVNWDNQIVQVGFTTVSGNFEPSGNFYDNVELSVVGP